MFKKFGFFLLLSFYSVNLFLAEDLPQVPDADGLGEVAVEVPADSQDLSLQFRVAIAGQHVVPSAVRPEAYRTLSPIIIHVSNTSTHRVQVGRIGLQERDGEGFVLKGRDLLRKNDLNRCGDIIEVVFEGLCIVSGLACILVTMFVLPEEDVLSRGIVGFTGLGSYSYALLRLPKGWSALKKHNAKRTFFRDKFPEHIVLQPNESIELLEFVGYGDVARLQRAIGEDRVEFLYDSEEVVDLMDDV